MPDPKAQAYTEKTVKLAFNALGDVLRDSLNQMWELGAQYELSVHARDLALLKTIKANINNDKVTDHQFREFLRSITS